MDWNLQNIKLYCPTFNEVPISVLHKSIESQKFQELSTEKRNTVNYGLETLTYRAPAIWAKLPPKYVDATSMDEFEPKKKILEMWNMFMKAMQKLPTKSRIH